MPITELSLNLLWNTHPIARVWSMLGVTLAAWIVSLAPICFHNQIVAWLVIPGAWIFYGGNVLLVTNEIRFLGNWKWHSRRGWAYGLVLVANVNLPLLILLWPIGMQLDVVGRVVLIPLLVSSLVCFLYQCHAVSGLIPLLLKVVLFPRF